MCCLYSQSDASAPYNTSDQELFTFSSSGMQYRLSLTGSGDINELNLFSAGGTFLGQFTPIAGSGGGSGSSGGSAGTYTLTVTGTYVMNGISIAIPHATVNNLPAAATSSEVQNAVTTQYGANGQINVTCLVSSSTQSKFRVRFQGGVSQGGVNVSVVYDYVRQ